jgi:hypothetical protein
VRVSTGNDGRKSLGHSQIKLWPIVFWRALVQRMACLLSSYRSRFRQDTPQSTIFYCFRD